MIVVTLRRRGRRVLGVGAAITQLATTHTSQCKKKNETTGSSGKFRDPVNSYVPDFLPHWKWGWKIGINLQLATSECVLTKTC